MFLSRIAVKRDHGLAALGPVLLPADDNHRAGVSHRLVWSAFGDDPDAKRDFLWREERPGQFLILSARRPANTVLFDIESRRFGPGLRTGDRLAFRLRVNATKTTTDKTTGKKARSDVVMAGLFDRPKGARAMSRREDLGWVEDEAGDHQPPHSLWLWLKRQGTANGFTPDHLVVVSYSKLQLPRSDGQARQPRRKRPIAIAISELEGTLTVGDPSAFLARVTTGFGRAKAFGCGLMLLKRLPAST